MEPLLLVGRRVALLQVNMLMRVLLPIVCVASRGLFPTCVARRVVRIMVQVGAARSRTMVRVGADRKLTRVQVGFFKRRRMSADDVRMREVGSFGRWVGVREVGSF